MGELFATLYYTLKEMNRDENGNNLINVTIDEKRREGCVTIRNPKGTEEVFIWDKEDEIWSRV